MKQTLQTADQVAEKSASSLSDGPVDTITINIFKPNWWHRVTGKPLTYTFDIYRTRVRNMKRCAAIACRIPEVTGDIYSAEELTGIVYPLVNTHADDLVYLIACCIHNQASEPSEWLINLIQDNVHGEQLFEMCIKCISNSGLQSFLAATALVRGTNVIIARGQDVVAVNSPEERK